MSTTLTFDEIERLAARRYAAANAPKTGLRTTTLTPLGRAIVLANRTGRAVAAAPTHDDRIAAMATAISSMLDAINAEPPSAA